jgi:hypothetical protein
MNASTALWGGPDDVFRRLTGLWVFERTVEGYGTMNGSAEITPIDQDWLAYREQGQFRLLNGQELGTQREYLFAVRPDGFNVFFKENPPRLFQEVMLSPRGDALSASAAHQCSNDLYASVYQFLPDGAFVIRHAAKGPRKNYTMVTIYRRDPAK